MEISVALRKESVDRNACIAGRRVGPGLSLSARRAWLEIPGGGLGCRPCRSRSPQGERG